MNFVYNLLLLTVEGSQAAAFSAHIGPSFKNVLRKIIGLINLSQMYVTIIKLLFVYRYI